MRKFTPILQSYHNKFTYFSSKSCNQTQPPYIHNDGAPVSIAMEGLQTVHQLRLISVLKWWVCAVYPFWLPPLNFTFYMTSGGRPFVCTSKL